MRFSILATLLAISASVAASPTPEAQRTGVLPKPGNFTLGLLPYQLATRLVKDGALLLELGPNDIVHVLKGSRAGLEERQAPVTGPIGNDLACAIGCAPI